MNKRTLGQRGKKQSQTKPIKANLLNAQMNVTSILTKDYENISNWAICENEPNTKPNKPNFRGKKCCSPTFYCGIRKNHYVV
jgi:hypothetical protein